MAFRKILMVDITGLSNSSVNTEMAVGKIGPISQHFR
jgi:hypothetical protein